MSCNRFTRTNRTIAPMIAPMIAALLASLAILAMPLAAPAADNATVRYPLGYDKAHEITLTGTIQEVVSRPATGVPAGLHVLVAGPQGTVDAHLGPYLPHDTQEALQVGVPVQIVGAMETLKGKNYLLARQVIFSGRLVTVRSANGFLLQAQPSGIAHHLAVATKTEVNGGAR